MKELKVNLENLSEAEREQLVALIEKANTPKSKWWIPKTGERYFYELGGEVEYSNNTDHRVDKNNIELGNAYRTREEARLAVERQKAKTKYLRFLRENEPDDWEVGFVHGRNNYFLYYRLDNGEVMLNYRKIGQLSPREFYSSEATLNKALNNPEIVNAWKCYMGIE